MVEQEIEDRLTQSKAEWGQIYGQYIFEHQSLYDTDYAAFQLEPEVKIIEASAERESQEITNFTHYIWEEKEMLWLSSIDALTSAKLMNTQLTSSYRVRNR
jgi:hypothetical protein